MPVNIQYEREGVKCGRIICAQNINNFHSFLATLFVSFCLGFFVSPSFSSFSSGKLSVKQQHRLLIVSVCRLTINVGCVTAYCAATWLMVFYFFIGRCVPLVCVGACVCVSVGPTVRLLTCTWQRLNSLLSTVRSMKCHHTEPKNKMKKRIKKKIRFRLSVLVSLLLLFLLLRLWFFVCDICHLMMCTCP